MIKQQINGIKDQKEVINKSKMVRQTCFKVSQQAKHVKIDASYMKELSKQFQYVPFNSYEHHHTTGEVEQILLYLFTLDSLNFCFWPKEEFQYQNLANLVSKAVKRQTQRLTLQKLEIITANGLRNLIFDGIEIPLEEQRANILRQMAYTVLYKFDGKFINIIQSASKSAVKLLDILTSNFPNFQDHSIYKGQQIHFYKRSQILIGDIWAKFQRQSIGQFYDIQQLTMFPDYRVPQILNQHKILNYSVQLKKIIEEKIEIPSGSEMQIQIRSCSVVAVEMIKEQINRDRINKVKSVEVDWFLWEKGQKNLKTICPHHRTLTIYY